MPWLNMLKCAMPHLHKGTVQQGTLHPGAMHYSCACCQLSGVYVTHYSTTQQDSLMWQKQGG